MLPVKFGQTDLVFSTVSKELSQTYVT